MSSYELRLVFVHLKPMRECSVWKGNKYQSLIRLCTVREDLSV